MPDSGGTYTRVTGAAPAANSVSSSSKFNSEMDDIATALNNRVLADGSGTVTADIPLGAHSLILSQRTDPSSPAADKAALYLKDNGSGTSHLYVKDEAGTVTDLMAGGSIGGSTGSTDNAVLRADGTGGSTSQASTVTMDDNGVYTMPDASTPSSPASGHTSFYSKSGKLTSLDSSGVERGLSPVGKHLVPIPAGAMYPATTNGCAVLAQAESSSNKTNYKYLAFDATNVEYAWFLFPAPQSYNASTFTAQFEWTHPATTTNFGVVWQVEMLALSDGDAIDTALGTAVTVTDTGGNTGYFYKSAATSAVTPSNSASKADTLAVRISRLASNGSDTLAVDAHLLNVRLFMTTDAATDD